MKKVLLIILAVFLTLSLLFIVIKYVEKKSADRHFDTYLKEHDYQEDVLSKETKYDSKMGKFSIIVYYKKYPKRKYEYYFLNNYISGAAYENDTQIDTIEYLEGTREHLMDT